MVKILKRIFSSSKQLQFDGVFNATRFEITSNGETLFQSIDSLTRKNFSKSDFNRNYIELIG
jgi:hypothetical protein